MYKFSKETRNKMRLAKLGKKRPDMVGHKWNVGRVPWNKGQPKLEWCGKNNPRWNGGKTKSIHGYIRIFSPSNPTADKYGYMPEHRFVAEKALKRFLDKNEQVHHINGNRTDNRVKNLFVFENRSQHQLYELHFKTIPLESNLT